MSRTFRVRKKLQLVESFKYSHFADIKNSQPLVDDTLVVSMVSCFDEDYSTWFFAEVLSLSETLPGFSTVIGQYKTRSRHSSKSFPNYTSSWDDVYKGFYLDKGSLKRDKMYRMMSRQLKTVVY